MVEGTGLENRRAVKRTEGSNPSPSAKIVLLSRKMGDSCGSPIFVGYDGDFYFSCLT